MNTPTQTEITQRNHRRAVRFFWGLLIGATTVSLMGNITHAALPNIPSIVVKIGAAAVPPIALLAAVHGIALAVRAGASGTMYRWAVSAVAAIGVDAFAVSFLALRDLMHVIGYGSATAWMFPAIIDTAIGVSTMMLVALGGKPASRPRAGGTQIAPAPRPAQGANTRVSAPARRQAVQPSHPLTRHFRAVMRRRSRRASAVERLRSALLLWPSDRHTRARSEPVDGCRCELNP